MVDLLIVFAFVLYAVSSGLRARKRASQNLSEYFLSGKTLIGWRAGVLAVLGVQALYYCTVINCVVIAMVLVAALRIAEVFLVWHAWVPTGLYAGFSQAIQGSGISPVSGQLVSIRLLRR